MRNIHFFDTTLRDGEQAPGNAMTIAQKIRLFNLLDAANVEFIEVGFPAASELDFTATKELTKLKRNACASIFARAIKNDIRIAAEAVTKKNNVQLQLLAVGSEIHLKHKRNISIDIAIQEIIDSIDYARKVGFDNISIGLEDAFRGSPEYLEKLINVCIEHQTNTIVIADTVGAATPSEFYELISTIKKTIGNSIQISVHCHNDMGLAVANSLEAIRAGANCVQTTLCGIGERAGNAAMEEILTVLHYKKNVYAANSNIDIKKIHDLCHILIELLKLEVSKHKAILGENVFLTSAGIHAKGIIANPITYEYIEPEIFGRNRGFLISRLSGRSLIAHNLEKLGIEVDEDILNAMHNVISSNTSITEFNNQDNLLNLYCNLVSQQP
jgi:2-isopropylmalate synthase